MFPKAISTGLEAALAAAEVAGELPAIEVTVEVERPRDPSHGNWSSNVALAASKAAGKNPREVAELLVAHLPEIPHLEGVDIAGPGFLNFRLTHSWLEEVLRDAAAASDFARSSLGGGGRVLVEYVSSNPTGPLHIGHARGGFLGDALSNLLDQAGYEVAREYYFNDAGGQMDRFAASFIARYRGTAVPEDGYHGDYVAEWAAELVSAQGSDLDDASVASWGVDRAMAHIRATLDRAGIDIDGFVSEQEIHDKGEVELSLDAMRKAGHVFEEEGATWFRATTFGDEKDRVLVKTDGSYTYVVPDIAYHWDKFERGYDTLINIWGADHHGYIPRLKAGVEAAGYDPDRLEILITQLVTLTRSGEPMKMSTRAGDFVSLDEVLAEVGVDATRYHLLAFSPDSAITFDLDEVARQSMDNPVYYLQYAHARMCSLERFAADAGAERGALDEASLDLLTHEAEESLLRTIDRLSEEIELAAQRRAPHRMCTYGYELATAFHKFYSDVRIVGEHEGEAIPPELTAARLWLVEAAKNALVAVLGILGISAPEEM
ncbi:MAG: arginine--tRNA ligase [Acidimicrobiia bacterium]|nr:arginine--tRNA ligase [Acidimicrobiia bacterium]